MSSSPSSHLVLLPCSDRESWAVPQACLGEILTLPQAPEEPPASIAWRGIDIPVLDRGAAREGAWRDPRGGALVAVFRGLKEEQGDCWAVAVRNRGLAVVDLVEDDIEEATDETQDNASAAFRYRGALYQVPNLRAWQRDMANNNQPAAQPPIEE